MPNTQELRATLHELNGLRLKHMGVHPEYLPAEEKQQMLDLASSAAAELRNMRHEGSMVVERFIHRLSQ